MFGRRRRDDETVPLAAGDWICTVELGEHWFGLPLDEDPREYADHVRRVLLEDGEADLGHPVPAERAEAVAEEFAAFGARVQESGAFGASLYRPVLDGPTVALLETHLIPERMRRGWEARVAEQYGSDPSARVSEVSTRNVGAAVRVHEKTGPSPDGEDAIVVEMVSHFFLSPTAELIRMTMSWTVPDDGELVALADEVLRAVRLG